MRTCTVCTHPARPAIDAALIAGRAYRGIAEQYGLGEGAVYRHRDSHLPQTLVKAQEQEDVRQALDVVAQLRAINGATQEILAEARRQDDPDVALKAIDRIQRQIELQAKLLGELDDRPQVNILISPEWLQVREAVYAGLAAYPEARIAVAGRLMALEAGHGPNGR